MAERRREVALLERGSERSRLARPDAVDEVLEVRLALGVQVAFAFGFSSLVSVGPGSFFRPKNTCALSSPTFIQPLEPKMNTPCASGGPLNQFRRSQCSSVPSAY